MQERFLSMGGKLEMLWGMLYTAVQRPKISSDNAYRITGR
jgi:hypothetical protein